MRRLGSARNMGVGGAPLGNSLDDAVVEVIRQATEMEQKGCLQEALNLYTTGIDLLMHRARAEPVGAKKQRIAQEAEIYMTRAENLKAALAPTRTRGSGRGGAQGARGGRGSVARRGGRRGTEEKRLLPDSSDVWGSARGRGSSGGGAKAADKKQRDTGASLRKGSTRGRSRITPRGTGRESRASSNVDRGSGGATGRSGGRGGSTSGGGRGNTERSSTPAAGSEHEEKIMADIVETSPGVTWESIAGLEEAKQTLQETVILPTLRPDLFTGLRAPSKGVLLYGPPGTGKTMLAKAVATESGYSFFSISASSLTSKWVGEGEKMVRALFSAARRRQPAVIFIDEIDSVLSARSEGENDASRRLKTEFLVQVDGVGRGNGGTESDNSGGREHLLILAATNVPQELDEAVLRRLSRRVYVPLPDPPARQALLTKLLASGGNSSINRQDMAQLMEMTEGYSGSDLTALCHVAAMQPIRELGARIRTVDAKDVRDINLEDFQHAITRVRATVSKKTVEKYHDWENSLSG